MNRIDKKFADLKREKRTGFVGYLTAGDPDEKTSEQNIRTALENGVDILELGVPFSDATADGPTIQEASQRALAGGMTVSKALEMVKRLRRDFDQPIVLFGYCNPFFRYGFESLCSNAAEAGADGLLIVDLAFEESSEIRGLAGQNGLYLIPLAAPTTDGGRARRMLEKGGGFVYYIMVTGVTGMRERTASDIDKHIAILRGCSDLPVAVGFGVRNSEQARSLSRMADAVVVGSALVEAARENRLKTLVADLSRSLRGKR
ncbi:MAG: tryptophan synthase subunit alpha [Kiritimatiellia bacterium]